MGQLVSSVLGTVGGLISGSKAADAAKGQAEALRAAGLYASRLAQFRPVGLTTGFGTSRFTVDKDGRVTSAGYQLTPELEALRNQLVTGAVGYDPSIMNQITMPLQSGVSSLFNLSQGYLSESPEAAAQRFVQQQQALIAPSREAQLTNVRSRLFGRGRSGLGVQTGTGTAPTSPELQAYYNALAQQDLELAARGRQAGMEQARFGTGLLTSAAELGRQIPAMQSAAFLPIETQLALARTIESMGQQPFLLSQQLAESQAGAGARAGQLYMQPQAAAAQAYSQYQGYSPLGSFLSGAGNIAGSGSMSSLFSGGMNPFNRYGSGMFDWGQVPTSVNRSWNSME